MRNNLGCCCTKRVEIRMGRKVRQEVYLALTVSSRTTDDWLVGDLKYQVVGRKKYRYAGRNTY